MALFASCLCLLLILNSCWHSCGQSGSKTKKTISFEEVLKDAKHHWSFDISGNLFWISDKKTGVSSKAKGNGARLIQAGLVRGVNYLRLKGSGSRLHLGYFSDCSTAIELCRGSLTISMWLRFREIQGSEQYFLGNIDATSQTSGYSMMRTTTGHMNFSVVLPSRKFYILYPSSGGVWEHHVITLKPNNDVNVYLNSVKAMRGRVRRVANENVEKKSVAKRDLSDIPKISRLLSLGRSGYKIDADYDNVAIWDRVLSDAEVKSLYKGGLTAPTISKQCRSNASAICISWPKLNDPYKQIMQVFTYFKIYTINEKKFGQKLVPEGDSTACVGDLDPLTRYTIGLYIRLRNAESLISRMIICETIDGVPFAPADLKGSGVSSSAIQATWRTPRPSNGKIIHYEVILKQDSDKKVITKYFVKPGDKYESYTLNITKLTSDTKYRLEMRSVGKLGESGKIDILITTQSPVPKIPVSGFTAVKVSWNQVKLSWTPLADPEKSTYIYEVSCREADGKTRVFRRSSNSITIRKLKQLTSYLFNIRVGTVAGFGPILEKELYVRTKDRNECADNWANLCDINAQCFNTEESYLCQCRNGYYGNGIVCRVLPTDAGLNNFCPAEVFRDIFWPRSYHGDTAVQPCPKGTRGFATRHCLPSILDRQASFAQPDLSKCVSEEIENIVEMVDNPNVPAITVVDKMQNATKHQGVKYGGDVKLMVGLFDSVLDKKVNKSTLTKTEAQDITKKIASVANDLLADDVMNGWKDIPVYPKDTRTKSASSLLDTIDGFAGIVSESLETSESYKVSLKNLEMLVRRIPDDMANIPTTYQRKQTESADAMSAISITLGSLQNAHGKTNLSVSFLSFNNAENLLRPSRNRSIHHTTGNSKLLVNSKVISASVTGIENPLFDDPVVIVLPHVKDVENVLNTSCVFWSESASGGGDWLSNGCQVNFTNASHTICHCNHLTNFAVLMSVSPSPKSTMGAQHQMALRIITYLGLFISLLALFLALFAFTCFSKIIGTHDSAHSGYQSERFLKSARTIYHRHLIVALIFAHILFLVGIERTEVQLACTLIAVFLHYFFLVAFVWMGMEGVLLYFMLTKIFNSRKLVKRKLFYVICWALPGIYVAVLASIFTPYYGTGDLCWLSAKDGFSWAFVGPVLIVISMNVGFMIRAFKVMAEKRKGPDDLAHEAWYWLKGCLVLTCVLGVTWIIGIFYVDSNTLVFAYIFNILNALQGLFIFIFHCIIDSRVRSEFLRILKCQTRSDYNEKAGYSSSLRFRYWSSTTKSNGSLDRSTISRQKRLNSDSLPDNNSRTESYGRHPSLLKAVPEVEEEKPKRNGHVPEAEPLLTAAPDVEFENLSLHSKPHSSFSDGDVFLDDVEIPNVQDSIPPLDVGRFSPIDSEVARRISETSAATLDDIADILEGKSPSTEEEEVSVSSSQPSNEMGEPDENEDERRSPYDKIERSMEELVISLGEEEEKIDNEVPANDDRPGLLVEVDASSTQSSLSAEMSLSDEEVEEEKPSYDREANEPCILDDDDLGPLLPTTEVDQPKCECPLDRESEPEKQYSKPEDLQLVHAQVEQKPCYAHVAYPPKTSSPPKSKDDKELKERLCSESDVPPELSRPEVVLPYAVE